MRPFTKLGTFVLAVALLVSLLAACASPTASFPSKPVDFVVAASPGGGSDTMARNILAVIEKEKLVGQTINVVNIPGGTKTYPDVGRRANDGYTIGIGNEDLIGAALTLKEQGQGGFSHKDVTIIARLALDTNTLTVRNESPYKTFQDFLDDAKKRPGEVNVGGSDLGGSDDTMLLKIEQATGAKVTYVRFKSGGESMPALLGGHVDVLSANPNEIAAQLEAGTVRVLAITGESRLKYLPDVPTMKESGVDITLKQFRGVIGPKNMDANALKFWQETLKKVSQSPAWEENYLKKYMLQEGYLAGAEYDKYFDEAAVWWEQAHRDLGLLK